MKKLLLLIVLMTLSLNSYAYKWSINLGFDNPPGSDIGLNYMALIDDNWAFEFGFGVPNVFEKNSSETLGARINMDLNLKYIFNGSMFRPYLQVGHTASILGLIGDEFDLQFSTGSGFFGGGLFILGSSAYLYLSGNKFFNGSDWFTQVGVGIYF